MATKKQSKTQYKWLKVVFGEIDELKRQVIDNTRFRLALETERCPECQKLGFKILDIEPPIICHSDKGMCPKHEKIWDEFIRRFTSN